MQQHCGKHAINVLVGFPAVTPEDLDEASRNLTMVTGWGGESFSQNPSYRYAVGGNWEVEVVLHVLNGLPGIRVASSSSKDLDIGGGPEETCLGYLVHTRQPQHYRCIKNVCGRLYIMDSLDRDGSHRQVGRERAMDEIRKSGNILDTPGPHCVFLGSPSNSPPPKNAPARHLTRPRGVASG